MPIRIDGNQFVDDEGRTVLFRGVNLGGTSKMPTDPCGYTWLHAPEDVDRFFNHRDVSFVGRPFPLEEADEHYARLKAWGFTLLRFVITWEAIEHQGPGIYDEDYLTYLRAVVEKAGEHGLWVWIDPHQDVWSRFTGGSGAPGWTVEAAGFDLRALKESGAAIVHQTHGDPLIRMVWPTNYTKLACATLFMLFFGGKTLAPNTLVEGESIQDYLQRHYLNAIQEVVRRVHDLPCVVGYGVMNEPNAGWIGMRNLNAFKWSLMLGPCCTPFQSMCLGHGLPTDVQMWDHGALGFKNCGKRRMNPKGQRAYREGAPDIWEANGVIAVKDGAATLLRPHHFAEADGKELDFYADFFVPFGKRFAAMVHAIHPEAFIFVEDAPFAPQDGPKRHLRWPRDPAEHVVCADHWYDGIPLVTGTYRPYVAFDGERVQVGPGRAQRAREKGIRDIMKSARDNMGDVPVVVGETGVPFDLDGGCQFRTGVFRSSQRALDGTLQAIETCMVGVTLWNYTSDNSNARGDNWNGEDLSLFSPDQLKGTKDLGAGGRGLLGAVRPHARRFAGVGLLQAFDMDSRVFRFRFRSSSGPVQGPNEFFVPTLQYPAGFEFSVSDGRASADAAKQLLLWIHDPAVEEHELRIWDPKAAARRPSLPQLLLLAALLLVPAALAVHFFWIHYWGQ